MATIEAGGGHGRRRVDQEIPLVPFVDLLLCCLMFLLVTAVWARLGSMEASTPGGSDAPSTSERRELIVTITNDEVRVASTLGDEATVRVSDTGLDVVGMSSALARHRIEDGGPVPVRLLPDDDVDAALLVSTMDALRGAGFVELGFPSAVGS